MVLRFLGSETFKMTTTDSLLNITNNVTTENLEYGNHDDGELEFWKIIAIVVGSIVG